MLTCVDVFYRFKEAYKRQMIGMVSTWKAEVGINPVLCN